MAFLVVFDPLIKKARNKQMLLYTCSDKTTLKGLTVVTILCKLSSEIDYVCATSDLSRTLRYTIRDPGASRAKRERNDSHPNERTLNSSACTRYLIIEERTRYDIHIFSI